MAEQYWVVTTCTVGTLAATMDQIEGDHAGFAVPPLVYFGAKGGGAQTFSPDEAVVILWRRRSPKGPASAAGPEPV